MKKSLFIFLVVITLTWIKVYGQEPSKSIVISGDITKEITFNLEDLKRFDSRSISDLIITNHSGEPRGTAKELKGFLVKELFEKVEFTTPSPKQLSEFYLVFEALDGYKVVFSWNELFNNSIGDEVFIITSMAGENLKEMKDGILLISHSDIRTGRRHVKNLSKIIVKRIE